MQKNTKHFDVNGKILQFDSLSFRDIFQSQRKKAGLTVLQYETELGELLFVSSNAIHNWRFGMNGPSDIETIKLLAKHIGIESYMLLLKDVKEVKTVKLAERQKDSIKRIYDAIIDYLDIFMNTNGFNDYWHTLCNQTGDSGNVEYMIYEIAEKEQHKVELVLTKEYIELHKHPLYTELEEYVCDYLCEMYNGKLSYAYRFEAPVENIDGSRDKLTTSEEYSFALKKINEIIDPYF